VSQSAIRRDSLGRSRHAGRSAFDELDRKLFSGVGEIDVYLVLGCLLGRKVVATHLLASRFGN
jgi:hypothetical protein